jgi:hypothetical protein
MLVRSFVKDPSAVLDYYMDWTAWLAGDTIVDSVWTATGGTVTLRDTAITGTFTSVWVEGGVAGELVDLLNHIITTEGREDERTLRLKVHD